MKSSVKQLVVRPFLSLVYIWYVKLPVVLIGAGVWERLVGWGAVTLGVLDFNPVLAFFAFATIMLDMFFGCYRAIRDGEGLNSRRMRATGWKVIEYGGSVLIAMILSAAMRRSYIADEWAVADESMLLYVIATEGVSALENLLGSKRRAKHLIDHVFRIGGDRSLTQSRQQSDE